MAELLTPLIIVLIGIGLSVAAVTLPTRGARRRVARARAGKKVQVPCYLRGSGWAYPPDFEDGLLTLGGESLVWRPLEGGSAPLNLEECRRVRVRPVADDDGLADDSEVCELRDPAGELVEIAVEIGEADLVSTAFRQLLPGEERQSSRDHSPIAAPVESRSATKAGAALLVLGLLAAGTVAALWLTGQPVVATVTESDDGRCSVLWSDPWDDTPRTGTVWCAEDAEQLQLRALRFSHGRAVGPRTTALGIAVPAVLLGAGALLRVRGRRVAPDVGSGHSRVSVPLLGRREPPSYDRVSAIVSARTEAEGWEANPSRGVRRGDRHLPWWRVPPLRASVTATAVAMVPVVVLAGLLPALVGARWWAGTAALVSGETTTVQATVSGAGRRLAPLTPAVVPVTFDDAAGRQVRTVVGVGEVPAVGEALHLQYAIAAPQHARAIDGDRSTVWATGSAAALLAALLVSMVRIGSAMAAARRLAALLRTRGRAVRYALFRDAAEGVGALVYPEERYATRDQMPVLLVALAEDVLGGVPLLGAGVLHGRPTHGETVVLEVDDVALWPAFLSEEPDAELVRELVNGID